MNEAELHGFADGGLERGRRDAVSAFLASSPVDAARVDIWRRQNEAIRAAFASIPAPPLPWSLSQAAGLADRIGAASWRERWSGRLILLAFAGGVLVTACADYFANHVGPPDADALLAAPILPALPAGGQTLSAVREMPGERGQMLCMFYTRKVSGSITLCAGKTPGPGAAAPHVTGEYPSAAITWRQAGATYAIAGALPEPELRALADAVRIQVDAFDGKE